jgi:predicted TPR repeat methyltransferase
MDNKSYLFSHMNPGKGDEYERMYETDPWLRYAWEREQATLLKILARHCQQPPIRWLDFACGTGRITRFLEGKVDEAVGVDVSEPMMAVAAKNVKRATLVHANLIENNVLDGQKFNLITAFRFFPKAEPELRDAALKVIAGLLSKDGRFVFNDHINRESMFHTYYRIKNRLSQKGCQPTFSIRECRKMLSRRNFEVVRVYSVGLLHLPRYHLPARLYHYADNCGCISDWLGCLSESPILVCKLGS